MAKSPEEYAHLEWLGYVQPIGLIVSVPAMLEAQCYINKNIIGEHARFLECLPRDKNDGVIPEITDFAAFAAKCLEWEAEDLKEIPQRVPLSEALSSLEVILPQYHETLRPTHAVPVFDPKEGEVPWQMLVQVLPTDTDFDEPSEADSSRHWHAAPQLKFERLLREAQVPIGLLSNCRQLRLVYAPRGESSGHATFNVDEMVQVAGRPMFAALHMLLSADRMFTLGEKQRLPAILANSRKYQNTVSTKLAEQVLAALYELMRGFQSANDVRKGELLRNVLASDPNQVYSGLLRVLMRLVFVLYAEDRDLMSGDSVYSNNYSISGLFERLREDAGRFPDTMDSRFGAWSQLLTLFRLVFEGGQHGTFKLPPRKGYLFDPDRFPFLEGRVISDEGLVISNRELTTNNQSLTTIPRISDDVVYRVLRNLLILDGERLSYRTLDVEQIGSVYETMMGFNLEVARGQAIAIKPVKSHGAPATINLDELLETKGKDRAKWIKEQTDQNITGQALKDLKAAELIDDLLVALDKKIAKKVTPRVVSVGSIVLQPSDERRRSGSHYTPRSLTEPIVKTTLEPILKQLTDAKNDLPSVWEPSPKDKKRYTQGEIAERIRLSKIRVENATAARQIGTPHPSQILDLTICDPAMGSGAFLVEACRQLGDELIKAWYAHDAVPTDIPPDEDEVLYARRLIAQRCLYGVDKNVMAVDLAKLSLWLVTLARDHAFTFLDHSLRHGDSLVGLTREQIIGFHWDRKKFKTLLNEPIQKRLDRATEARAKILNSREDVPYRDQEQRLAVADEALDLIRSLGDACVSCFFAESKKKAREEEADRVYGLASSYLESIGGLGGQGSRRAESLTSTPSPDAVRQEPHAPGIDFASRQSLAQAAARLAQAAHPIPAFHWEIEFPEVFARENGGFDAFVGNPPFLGGTLISGANSRSYLEWLYEAYEGCGNRCDLVAYFFRRSFDQLRQGGAFGLIGTESVRVGDTREGGIYRIVKQGGRIFCATRRMKWPGEAAVLISIVHMGKAYSPERFILDGELVETITAYLFNQGPDDNPKPLAYKGLRCYEGFKPGGQGFLFDDKDAKANPLAEMHWIVKSEPNSAKRIRPYIGGDEVNNSPTHSPHRYAIYFGDLSEDEAKEFPALYDIVVREVKPKRLQSNRVGHKRYWWRYAETRPGMVAAMDGLSRVLAISKTTKYVAFTFLSQEIVFSEKLKIIPSDNPACFSVLQTQIHDHWCRFFAGTRGEGVDYVPTDCFDTYPFPKGWEDDTSLSEIGTEYFAFRADLMRKNDEGLTDTYNRFHDPHEQSEGILELRRLHGLMDGAVLRAYGWDDLAESARCEFLLDYEEEEDDAGAGPGSPRKKSKKKKPWRLRWPDEFRDEVLARLLELNEQRHKEEQLAGKANAKTETKSTSKKTAKRKTGAKRKKSASGELF